MNMFIRLGDIFYEEISFNIFHILNTEKTTQDSNFGLKNIKMGLCFLNCYEILK